jgi:hypothetical protein
MRKILAVSLFLTSPILWAQSRGSSRDPNYAAIDSERRLQQQSFEQWARQPESERQDAAHRVADEKFREFYSKAQRFVVLWQQFSKSLSDRKTFDAKLAKQVSKAFHDLEKSDGWPAGRSK